MSDWDRYFYFCEWLAFLILLPQRTFMGLFFGDWWERLLG